MPGIQVHPAPIAVTQLFDQLCCDDEVKAETTARVIGKNILKEIKNGDWDGIFWTTL